MIKKPISLSKTILKTMDTEKNNRKVVMSAAIPIDFFRFFRAYLATAKVNINKIAGIKINAEIRLIMSFTCFIHFF